jgi:cation-transporting ATPase E
VGLSPVEVASRVAAGEINSTGEQAARPISTILRTNIFTRFNAILGSLLVVVAVVGPPQDGLFGVILVVNTAVGVAQELRARRTLERLAVLTAPTAHAIRNAAAVELRVGDVVLGDVLELSPGDQVVVDGRVLVADHLEVDESLLTGEAVAVSKAPGEEVLSGSFVVAGAGRIAASRVGADAYAQRIQGEARRFSLVRSELQQGTNTILRIVTWAMIPAGGLVATSQLLRSGQSLEEALRACVAAIGAMVPEGLVLLTSLAFALGAIRLARRSVLVQELAAIEGLARVDVLCIDKTGTLTEPRMRLAAIDSFGSTAVTEPLSATVGADPSPNSTMQALAAELPLPPGWVVESRVPFTSARKWSAAQFSGHGTWVLGAPEIVLEKATFDDSTASRIADLTTQGSRVLILARSDAALSTDELPGDLEPAGLVSLQEELRPDARATIAYLVAQGIAVKVLSGDDPRTVGVVASRVGVQATAEAVDARSLPDDLDRLAAVLEVSSVFGRVQPQQKKLIVEALQLAGHTVAMTGDGVNDVPALKQADLSIAMGSGSQATRAVARVVLLESSFATVPHLLDEGRRVISNIERVAKLFVAKTVYATILAVVVGIVALPFPFYPRHFTIVSSLTIGIPAFFLALATGAPRAHPGFVQGVLQFTVPVGGVAASATLLSYLVASGPANATLPEARSAATLTLLAVGLCIVALVARPLSLAKWVLITSMGAAVVVLWIVPIGRRVFSLSLPPTTALSAEAAIVIVSVPLLMVLLRASEAIARRHKGTCNPGSRPACIRG